MTVHPADPTPDHAGGSERSFAEALDQRVGCSTISLRSRSLPEALAAISAQGFTEVDLGALPGICEHVPHPLPPDGVRAVAAQARASGLAVRSINADIGPLDDEALTSSEVRRRLRTLVELAATVDSSFLVLPCGRPLVAGVSTATGSTGRTGADDRPVEAQIATVARALAAAAEVAVPAGVELLVEAPHSRRLCGSLERSARLYELLGDAPVGAVLDLSHVVAAGEDVRRAVDVLGDRIRHVHLRDAVRGDINLSIGRGEVDFAAAARALSTAGYEGHYSLELETHDVGDADRPSEAGRAGRWFSGLLRREADPTRATEPPPPETHHPRRTDREQP